MLAHIAAQKPVFKRSRCSLQLALGSNVSHVQDMRLASFLKKTTRSWLAFFAVVNVEGCVVPSFPWPHPGTPGLATSFLCVKAVNVALPVLLSQNASCTDTCFYFQFLFY